MQFTYLTTTMDDGIYMGLDKSQWNISGTSTKLIKTGPPMKDKQELRVMTEQTKLKQKM